MKMLRRFSILSMCLFYFFLFGTIDHLRASPFRLEPLNGGFFSIYKPAGWQMVTAGQCSTFAFLMRDPANALRQIFYFSEVGPVYMSEQQKQLDWQYMNMGGYPIQWIEMPVIAPLTPGNFLSRFHQIARTKIARNFMPQCPTLDGIQIIQTVPQPAAVSGGRTELIRALFVQDNQLGEGLFTVTVAPHMQFTGGPGGGTAYGFLITGVTAPKNEFMALQKTLVQALGSFKLSNTYAQQCMQQQAAAYRGDMRAGDTLRETSDIIMRGWENRNKAYDIIAEKRSDTMLGMERLYDPDTGKVYEFENSFYDTYDLNRRQYEMNNLRLLEGENYDLWMAPRLNGPRHLH
jgi:hypothetical protein